MICARKEMSVLTTVLRIMLIALALSAIASCGGDSGISLGEGQDPDPVVVDYPIFYVKRIVPVDRVYCTCGMNQSGRLYGQQANQTGCCALSGPASQDNYHNDCAGLGVVIDLPCGFSRAGQAHA